MASMGIPIFPSGLGLELAIVPPGGLGARAHHCSPSGLELVLTIAPPGSGNAVHISSSSSDGNKGSSTENMRELALLDTFNNGDEVDERHIINYMGTEREEDRRPVGGSSFQQRKHNPRLSKEQTDLLEASFQQNHFPDKGTMQALADTLKVKLKKVQVWFMNRRSRLKKQTMEQKEKELNSYKEKELNSYKMQVESLTNETHHLRRKLKKLNSNKMQVESLTNETHHLRRKLKKLK